MLVDTCKIHGIVFLKIVMFLIRVETQKIFCIYIYLTCQNKPIKTYTLHINVYKMWAKVQCVCTIVYLGGMEYNLFEINTINYDDFLFILNIILLLIEHFTSVNY